MSIRLSNIRLSVDEPELALPSRLARALNLRVADIDSWRILRKSLDVRDKSDLAFVYSVEVNVPQGERRLVEKAVRCAGGVAAELYHEPPFELPQPGGEPLVERPVVVGSGPAGAMAAVFLAQHGYRPIVLERGRAVRERIRDVQAFDAGGPHNPESNYLFGEGVPARLATASSPAVVPGPMSAACSKFLPSARASPRSSTIIVRIWAATGCRRWSRPCVNGSRPAAARCASIAASRTWICTTGGFAGCSRRVVICRRPLWCWASVTALEKPMKCCWLAACQWFPSRFRSACASSNRRSRSIACNTATARWNSDWGRPTTAWWPVGRRTCSVFACAPAGM